MAAKDNKESSAKDQKVGSNLSQESIRVIAESVGIANLPDEAASYLSEQMTYYLKATVQVCACCLFFPLSLHDESEMIFHSVAIPRCC